MLHYSFHVGFHHDAAFGSFQHHAHHRRVRHDFDDSIAHARIFEAIHHRLREARPIQRIDAFDAVLHPVLSVHRRIHGQIAALGVAGEHNRRVLPQRGDSGQIVGGGHLRRHRVLEGHVEVLFPTHERIVGTAERHNQHAGRQAIGRGGELRLLIAVELLEKSAHLNAGKTRIRGDGMVEIVRHLRIDQAHVLDIMVGHRASMVQLVVGARDRHTVEWRFPQHPHGAYGMARVELLHTVMQRAISRFDVVKPRHAFRHVVVRKLREHERVGLTEGKLAEIARLRTRVIDDVAHCTPLSQPSTFRIPLCFHNYASAPHHPTSANGDASGSSAPRCPPLPFLCVICAALVCHLRGTYVSQFHFSRLFEDRDT